jgi:replication factor A1
MNRTNSLSNRSKASSSADSTNTGRKVKRFGLKESVSKSSETTNSENLCTIDALSPYKEWTIRVRVTAKTQVKTFNNKRGDGKLFSFDVTDDSSEIRITAFNKECDKYFNIIKKDLVYYITKGIVKTANKKFIRLESDYEIILTNDSVIELCNQNIPLPKMNYKFVEFKDLPNISVNTTVDVIAVITNISDLESIVSNKNSKEYKKRDISLLDTNSIEVRMTVWRNEAENFNGVKGSIVAVKNAIVSDFKRGRNLNGIEETKIEYEPDLPEAHILKKWYDREGQNVTNIVSMSKTIDSNTFNTFKYLSQINMNSVPNDSTLYFNCKAVIININSNWYKSCGLSGCSKKVRDESIGIYKCNKCETESSAFQWCIMLSVCIRDSTGDIWANIFQELVEKMIGLKVHQLRDLFTHNSEHYYNSLNTLLNNAFEFTIAAQKKKNETFQYIILSFEKF